MFCVNSVLARGIPLRNPKEADIAGSQQAKKLPDNGSGETIAMDDLPAKTETVA